MKVYVCKATNKFKGDEMEKCNCELRQAANDERISLELNTDFFENICCCLCGGITTPDGFDFVIDGTQDFVCLDCAKKKAPDLYFIHRDAHAWRAKGLENSFNEARK